ncbi:MAG: reverse transcriptase domain-containing protein, partial [Pseudomonas fluorescens]
MNIEEIFKNLFRPGFSDLDNLCRLLKVDQKKLLSFLYKKKSSHYVNFSIPKRNGTPRAIVAPKRVLKRL